MSSRGFTSYRSMLLVACCLIGAGCAHDTYQDRADMIKNHSDAFYDSLKANRVESAIRNNEQIEAMANQMGDTVRKRAGEQGTTAVEREFALMKTANEAAATNWLALGQYFAIKRQYPQARATYRRVIDTYTNPTDRPYREQALRALKDWICSIRLQQRRIRERQPSPASILSHIFQRAPVAQLGLRPPHSRQSCTSSCSAHSHRAITPSECAVSRTGGSRSQAGHYLA